MQQTRPGRERWRVRCRPFGSEDGRPRVGEVLIQGATSEGVTIVAPGGGFRLGPEELRQLADSVAEASRVQRRCAEALR